MSRMNLSYFTWDTQFKFKTCSHIHLKPLPFTGLSNPLNSFTGLTILVLIHKNLCHLTFPCFPCCLFPQQSHFSHHTFASTVANYKKLNHQSEHHSIQHALPGPWTFSWSKWSTEGGNSDSREAEIYWKLKNKRKSDSSWQYCI